MKTEHRGRETYPQPKPLGRWAEGRGYRGQVGRSASGRGATSATKAGKGESLRVGAAGLVVPAPAICKVGGRVPHREGGRRR